MRIEKLSYRGDTNIGFYTHFSNSYAIVPRGFESETFEQKTVETRISGTRMLGLFTAGNSNCLLLPESVKDREVSKIEEEGVNCKIIESRENALGNLILANGEGAVISRELEDKREEISEALDVQVKVQEIAGIDNPGVCGVVNSKGVLLHRDTSEEEAEAVKEALNVENVNIGTINMGSPYLGSGLVASDELILTGEDTTGPEIGRIDRTLM